MNWSPRTSHQDGIPITQEYAQKSYEFSLTYAAFYGLGGSSNPFEVRRTYGWPNHFLTKTNWGQFIKSELSIDEDMEPKHSDFKVSLLCGNVVICVTVICVVCSTFRAIASRQVSIHWILLWIFFTALFLQFVLPTVRSDIARQLFARQKTTELELLYLHGQQLFPASRYRGQPAPTISDEEADRRKERKEKLEQRLSRIHRIKETFFFTAHQR